MVYNLICTVDWNLIVQVHQKKIGIYYLGNFPKLQLKYATGYQETTTALADFVNVFGLILFLKIIFQYMQHSKETSMTI